MLIGVMHIRKDPTKIAKLYTLAAAAKMEGVDFCYFSPGKVDFENRKIEGYYYEREWKQKTFPYPDIIINMTGPRTPKQLSVSLRLRKEIPFTESKIHNKNYIQKLLHDHPIFTNYLPESIVARSEKRVVKFMDKHKRVVLKPSVGCKGQRIFFITKHNKSYIINYGENEEVMDNLTKQLSEIKLTKYIAQEFIVSETNEGLPADFRIHTQKNEKGKYVITTIYPRIGDKKNKVSNISQGGYSANIELYLKNQFKDKWLNIYNNLKVFGLQISEYLDEHYNNKLNQLGVDVCIDKSNKLYLIEVNWRPGLPVLFSDNINHIKNLIKYSIYRVNTNKDDNEI
ncbi:YheC/YheD family protein [Mycoplasmatota bacterium WC44]